VQLGADDPISALGASALKQRINDKLKAAFVSFRNHFIEDL
jgi:hypothetical protein